MPCTMAPTAYHPTTPIALQPSSWRCCVASLRWCLAAYGRPTEPGWLADEMVRREILVPQVGMRDKTGRELAAFVNDRFGRSGFWADSLPDASYDWVQASAKLGPAILYGEAWKHWTAVRGAIPHLRLLVLANANPGYGGIHLVMPARTWDLLGPINLTIIRRHP